MKSGNPALSEHVFTVRGEGRGYVGSETMTLGGTALKAGILLAIVFATALWVWNSFPPVVAQHMVGAARWRPEIPAGLGGWMLLGALGGFVVALITIFNPKSSPFTSPFYAALEGLALGGISVAYEGRYPGIAMTAVGVTFSVFAAMLLLYATRIIRPSENLKLGIVAATGGVALLYLIDLGLSFFGMNLPLINSGGVGGIVVSLVISAIAAFNLVIDFDFIEQGVDQGAPKYMEWYGAFGLLVTLVWLYLEILRLLAKAQGKK